MSDQSIKEAVQKLAGTHLKDDTTIKLCTVNSVDVNNGICDCTSVTGSSEIEIPNVRLQPDIADGLLLVPKVGSIVLVAYTKRHEPFILLFSDLDYVGITVGNTIVEVKNGSIALGDGSFGGLIKIQALLQKINNLENAYNDLATKYNAHTHAANGSPTVIVETTVLTLTQRTDLENSTITHGQ